MSELGSTQGVTAVIGTARTRAARLVRRVLVASFAAAVAGGFAAALTPWGVTTPWLATLCAMIFLAWGWIGLRYDLRSIDRLELLLDEQPRQVVLRGPWATRRHGLTEVTAIQEWCGCGTARAANRPHRDRLEVLLADGEAVEIEAPTAFGPDVGLQLRELLAPLGVRVVDWGGADA